MSNINIGLEINTALLSGGDIQILLDSGINSRWLSDPQAGSQVIFADKDKQVFTYLLDYHKKHRRIPEIKVFRQSHPEETYRLSDGSTTLSELTDLAADKINKFLVAQLVNKTIEFHDKDKIQDAIDYLKLESHRLATSVKYSPSSGFDITDPKFDIDTILNLEYTMGIPFGLAPVDEIFYGFQPGHLITLLGRQKASKTWLTLNSALHAWKAGYSVLFFSVEMSNDLLQQRLLSVGANVSPGRMRRGKLNTDEKDKVRTFQQELSSSDAPGRFILLKKKSLVTVDDLREELKRYHPDIIYIDGFSFMMDSKSNDTTENNWKANGNLAYELKGLAMEEEISVFVNTQAQEKQYNNKNGIEAKTISGGTGLLKASDLVIGLNYDEETKIRTVSSVLSRFEEFDTFKLEIDFDYMTFSVLNHADNKDKLQKLGV